MVVRDRVGRKRYIAFEILSGADILTRGKLAKVLKANRNGMLRGVEIEVIMIEKGRGIVRTDHRSARVVVDLLRSFDHEREGFELKPLKTSGTIKKLKRKYFISRAKHQDLRQTNR